MKDESPAQCLDGRADRICKACLLHLRRMAGRVVGGSGYESFEITELEGMETDRESGIGLGRSKGRRTTLMWSGEGEK